MCVFAFSKGVLQTSRETLALPGSEQCCFACTTHSRRNLSKPGVPTCGRMQSTTQCELGPGRLSQSTQDGFFILCPVAFTSFLE